MKSGFVQAGPSSHVTGLLPGLTIRELLADEMPTMIKMFRNTFAWTDQVYPAENFRTPSWIHSGRARKTGGLS